MLYEKKRDDLMVKIIKEYYIEESIKELLGDTFEYNFHLFT